MGFWKNIKELSTFNKKRRVKQGEREASVNQNPTEEELKNNKKGKLSYLWTAISVVVYFLGFLLVAAAWGENVGAGIMALIFVLLITPIPHRKAISLAKEQRRINGKGLGALILATALPLVILAAGFLFFVFGWLFKL